MDNNYFYLIAVAVFIVFAVVLFFVIRLLIHKNTDKKIERYQTDLLKKHYDEVDNMYRQMRGWRHDYKNHIATMKVYLDEGNMEALSDYLDELNTDLNTVDTVLKTGNVMVDAILNSKLSLAKSNSISVEADAAVPGVLSVSNTDMCVIIGNLLDNAIEAAVKNPNEEKRFIRVYIGIFKKQLYISVTNSVGGALKKEGKSYFSTKGSDHGFGLKRIDKIVSKYSGWINRTDETDVFATEITLPL